MTTQADRWELTANQYLALPLIDRADASVHCLNVLMRSALGLVEWCGDTQTQTPLLTPVVRVDGHAVMPLTLAWERLDRWIPRATAQTPDGLTIHITLCAPTGFDASRRGAFYNIEIENHSASERVVTIELSGVWTETFQTVGTRRPSPSVRRIALSAARPGIVLELAGPHSVALGLVVFGAETSHRVQADATGELLLEPGQQRVLAEGEAARFSARRVVNIAAGRRAAATFYLGVAAEREGALATAAALRRRGSEQLIKETRLELSRVARKTRDAVLGSLLNRNLIFAYFFSVARALDDDRLYPITSRSPLHPRCGTFNERDALLWAFPALLLADPPLARELILRACEQYSHRPGECVRYVEGGVLEPGFALDRWCGYVLATAAYIDATGDGSLAEEPLMLEVLRELETGIYFRLHPEVFLAETEVLPSGEAADFAFVTYDNALLHAAFRALVRLRGEETDEGKRSVAAADEVAAAIWRRCATDVEGLPVLAFSTDLHAEANIYDDPAGSLQLLPHYKFCDFDEPVWRNTVDFLRSARYPLWLGGRKCPGLASRTEPHQASLAALCADLLGTRRSEALAVMRHLELPAGVATTRYDPDSGQGVGGLHDAALAGFVAWSLHQALNA
ncbi:MAG: glycoside hydrolase family 125 protein [Longimicrobiales bacterium]